MSLFSNENILTKEIESWKGFANSFHADNRELFMNMLNDVTSMLLQLTQRVNHF